MHKQNVHNRTVASLVSSLATGTILLLPLLRPKCHIPANKEEPTFLLPISLVESVEVVEFALVGLGLVTRVLVEVVCKTISAAAEDRYSPPPPLLWLILLFDRVFLASVLLITMRPVCIASRHTASSALHCFSSMQVCSRHMSTGLLEKQCIPEIQPIRRNSYEPRRMHWILPNTTYCQYNNRCNNCQAQYLVQIFFQLTVWSMSDL